MHVKKSARTSSASKKHLKPLIMATLAMPALFTAVQSTAAVKYWDLNGSSGGFGASATGTWDTTTANWNVNSSGSGPTTTWSSVNPDTAVFSTSGTVTIGSGITAGGITVAAGNLTLASGSVNIGTGSITVDSGAKLSLGTTGSSAFTASAGSSITLDGGTLENLVSSSTGPSFITNNTTIVLTANGGTLSTSNAAGPTIIQTGTNSTTISGPGALTKTGAGVLAIATTGNTWSGGTIINNGEIRIRTSSNTLPTTTQVTIGANGILNLNNLNQTVDSISGSGQIGFGSGVLTIGGAEDTTFTGTWAPVASVAGSGGVTSGVGRVNKTGTGALTLGTGFTSSITGSVTVAAGSLNLMAGTLGGSAIVDLYVNGGSMNFSNGASTIENLSGTGGTVNVAAGSTLSIATVNDRTYAGALAGSGNIVKSGANFLRLAGTSTFNGNFSVTAGVLELGAGNAPGVGVNIALAGGSLRGTTAMTLNAADTIVLNTGGSTIETSNASSGSTLTFGGLISGVQPLTKIGPATLLLNGSTNQQSKNIVSAGTLNVQNDGSLGTVPASVMADNVTLNASTLQISGSTGFTLNSNRGIDIGGAGSTLNVTNNASGGVTYGGKIAGTGGLTRVGSGLLTLTGASTFTGGLTLAGGATAFNNNSAVGSNLITVTPSSNTTMTTSTVSAAVPNNIVFNTSASVEDIEAPSGDTLALTGQISGSGAVIRGNAAAGSANTSGAVEIDGHNTGWTGGLTLKQGILAVGDTSALGTGTLTVTSPTNPVQPVLQASTALTGSNAIGNAITLNNNLVLDGSNDIELSGAISGAAALTVSNSATTIMSANSNSYGGGTTVAAGTLRVSNTSGSATGTGPVAVTGGTLAGSGIVSGTVSVTNGSIAPGVSGVGTLSTGALSLSANATTVMELSSGSSYDKLAASGAVTYGGALNVSTVGGYQPTAGEKYTIFSGTSLSGSFSSYSLPSLTDPSARWNTTNLAVDGSIAVTSAWADLLDDNTSTKTDLGTANVTGGNGNYNIANVSMTTPASAGSIHIAGLSETPVEVLLDLTDDSKTAALVLLLNQVASTYGFTVVSSDKSSGLLAAAQYIADYDVQLEFTSAPASTPFQFEYDFTHANSDGSAITLSNIGVVPEPTTASAIVGLGALASLRRRRRAR